MQIWFWLMCVANSTNPLALTFATDGNTLLVTEEQCLRRASAVFRATVSRWQLSSEWMSAASFDTCRWGRIPEKRCFGAMTAYSFCLIQSQHCQESP